jgi:hypothetical protein
MLCMTMYTNFCSLEMCIMLCKCSFLSACFLNVICIDMRVLSQDKIALRVTEYKTVHTVIYRKTQHVYSFSASIISILLQ